MPFGTATVPVFCTALAETRRLFSSCSPGTRSTAATLPDTAESESSAPVATAVAGIRRSSSDGWSSETAVPAGTGFAATSTGGGRMPARARASADCTYPLMSTAPSTASTRAVSAAMSRVFMSVLLGQGDDVGVRRVRRAEGEAFVERGETEELADEPRVRGADGEAGVAGRGLAGSGEAPAEQLEAGPAGDVVLPGRARTADAVEHGQEHRLAEQRRQEVLAGVGRTVAGVAARGVRVPGHDGAEIA